MCTTVSGERGQIYHHPEASLKETLAALEMQMKEIRQTSTLPSLKISGMGILHVYIRFFLLYGENFVFRLENNPEGGACVVIGGDLNGPVV